MANIPKRITELMQKDLQLTSQDLDEIENELIIMDPELRYAIEGDVLEGIELTISDPAYLGDIELSDLDRLSADEDL